MRASALALGVAAVMAISLQPLPARGQPDQSVTMTFVRFYDNACRCYKARLSGQISSGEAGEYVTVMRQYCGRSFSTAVGGATTRADGFWKAELLGVSRPEALVSETYRARWGDVSSAPVTFRGKLSVSGGKSSGGRHRVTVSTFGYPPSPQNMSRRTVLLQRQTGGTWARIASARLAPHPVKYYTFIATFSLPRRGWTVRALVPAKSAAPCFVTSASEAWTS